MDKQSLDIVFGIKIADILIFITWIAKTFPFKIPYHATQSLRILNN